MNRRQGHHRPANLNISNMGAPVHVPLIPINPFYPPVPFTAPLMQPQRPFIPVNLLSTDPTLQTGKKRQQPRQNRYPAQQLLSNRQRAKSCEVSRATSPSSNWRSFREHSPENVFEENSAVTRNLKKSERGRKARSSTISVVSTANANNNDKNINQSNLYYI